MSALRASLHLQALEHIRCDRFIDALELLKKTIQQHGPNVRCLLDIASCYYMLDDHPKFIEATQKLEQEFKSAEPNLTEETYLRTLLGLGKLQEECGKLTEAHATYSNVTLSNTDFPDLRDRIIAQKLRIKAQWKIQKELENCYAYCEKVDSSNYDVRIENQHALMLAECSLIGLHSASSRFQKLRSSLLLRSSDYRLLLFDLLYEYLIRGKTFDEFDSLSQQLNYFECDSFEKALWDCHLAIKNNDLSLISTERTSSMSLVSSLRYLTLLKSRAEFGNLREEAQRKLHVFLFSLNGKNIKLVQQAWLQTAELSSTLILDVYKGLLSTESGHLQLKTSDLTFKLLLLFQTTSRVSTEDAILRLFNLPWDEYSYDRLRSLVKRTDKSICKNLGITRAIKLTKEMIQLETPIVFE